VKWLPSAQLVVLEAEPARAATTDILKVHCIPLDRSADLANAAAAPAWLCGVLGGAPRRSQLYC